jgi:hypothetical protein
MDLNKIIEEIYDSGGGNYPAYSSPPRKDFAPISMKNGYDYPYQQNTTAGELGEPPPDAPIAFPWPLQTITDDLSDGFVFVMTATNKIRQCVAHNPSISKEQKLELIELYKKCKAALDLLKDIGTTIHASNIAGPQPSQNPVPTVRAPMPESLPDSGTTVMIKLPS